MNKNSVEKATTVKDIITSHKKTNQSIENTNKKKKLTMIKKNFIIALRSLMNHKKYALINIFGLAIGLACFILITIWVQDELSYDNFHKDADNVHIVFRKENGKRIFSSSKLLFIIVSSLIALFGIMILLFLINLV